MILGGFNNSIECSVANPPLTTVSIPSEELALDAWQMISSVISGAQMPADTVRKTELVVRESCGCDGVRSWAKAALADSRTIENQQQLADALGALFRLSPREKEKRITPLIRDFAAGDSDSVLQKYSVLVQDFLMAGGEASDLFPVFEIFERASFVPEERRTKVLQGLDKTAVQMQSRRFSQTQYESFKTFDEMSKLKVSLLTVHDRENLIKRLASELPKIGIKKGALILYEDNTFSRYEGGFSAEDGVILGDSELFPSELLVPSSHKDDFLRGVFVVEPLFIENQPLGYFIASYDGMAARVYEDLRSSISSSLQGIMQFEETSAAKSAAERAEFAKTEFFANVGSDLRDPLSAISAKIEDIEKCVSSEDVSKDIISDQLLFLKSLVLTQMEKVETLVDLTKSQVNDLPMDKKLFDVQDALPEAKNADVPKSPLPLLFGDLEKLARALEILASKGSGAISVKASTDGVHIKVNTGKVNWTEPPYLLASKIIALQFATIERGDNNATVIFPYPNLSALPPKKSTILPTKILSLGGIESKKTSHLKLPVLPFGEGVELSDENFILQWNPDGAPIDDWLKIYALRRSESLSRIPILCASKAFEGKTFLEVIEQKVRMEKSSSVLFIGCRHTRYSPWATDRNSISIQSMSEFDKVLEELNPSLIVFEKTDKDAIKQIRQNRKTVLTPIFVLPDKIVQADDVAFLCENPRIILCNRGAAESEQFAERVQAILQGDEILPPHTGALVKNAILYLNKKASEQIVRWKLADEVHVSEDYLTRIFHKEIGLSLWEYLNRYRIYIATELLLETNLTIYEIAEKSGFQDQAYFCRVFKKIYGVPPGKIRTNTRDGE